MKYEGKVCIVTGAASGLGLGIAKKLVSLGAKVGMLDIDAPGLEAAASDLPSENVMTVQCDVTKTDVFTAAIGQVVASWGHLDLLVNNAGLLSEKNWAHGLAVNLHGVVGGTLAAIEVMGTHRGGRGGLVVNVSSVSGLYPNPFTPVYVASKYGVSGFTMAMGSDVQFAYHGVRCCAICPSFTTTSILSSADKSLFPIDQGGLDEIDAKLWGPVMTPEFVAGSVEKLVDEVALNGVLVRVSPRGGYEVLPNTWTQLLASADASPAAPSSS